MRRDAAAEADGDGSLTRPALIVTYLLAHGGKTLFWAASDLYFVFYLNPVCGIAPAMTGLVVGVSILFAALADVSTGNLFRVRIRTPGQAGCLQVFGGIGSALMLVLFAMTAFIDTRWRVPSAVAALMLLRLSYALIDVPQNALLSFAPWSKRELTALVTGRNIVGGLSRMLLAFAFVPVMKSHLPTEAAARFLWLVVAISVVMVCSVATLSVQLNSVRPRLSVYHEAGDHRIGRHLIRVLIVSLMITGFTQLEPYLASRVIDKVDAAVTFLTAVSLGGILCQPLWRWRAMNAPRSRVFCEIMTAAFLAAGCIAILPLNTVIGCGGAGALCGLVSGGTLFFLWAEFAAMTEGANAFSAFGRFTAAAKLGQGVAIILIGYWLQWHIPSGTFVLQAAIRWLACAALIVGTASLAFVPADARTRLRDGV